MTVTSPELLTCSSQSVQLLSSYLLLLKLLANLLSGTWCGVGYDERCVIFRDHPTHQLLFSFAFRLKYPYCMKWKSVRFDGWDFVLVLLMRFPYFDIWEKEEETSPKNISKLKTWPFPGSIHVLVSCGKNWILSSIKLSKMIDGYYESPLFLGQQFGLLSCFGILVKKCCLIPNKYVKNDWWPMMAG